MDELLKKREVFFNNLIILGLDSAIFEKKYGITFHRDMFVLPNKKGYEVVTHFLFSKLSAATNQDYNLPWPLFGKELERVFQKTCYNHFGNFAQENVVRFPRIVPSLLSTFGGSRFYDLYLAFSSYVLFKTLKKNGCKSLLSMPTSTQESFSVKEDILQLSTIRCMQNCQNIQSVTHSSHLVWTKFTKNLSQCLEKLKRLLKESEELKRRHLSTVAQLIGTPTESVKMKKIIDEIYECYKPKMRKELERFYSSEANLWQHLASEIGENKESLVLNGPDFGICVTDSLPEECRSQLEKTGFTSSKEDGKLSVVRFIKLLEGFLKFFTQVLLKTNLTNLHKSCHVEDASAIEDSLRYVDNLVKRLAEKEIPEMEDNIQKQKLISGFDDLNKNSSLSQNLFCPSLPVHSFDPEAVKERVTHFDPGEIFQFSTPGLKEPGRILTNSASDFDSNCTESLSELLNSQYTAADDTVIESPASMAASATSFLPDPLQLDSFSDVFYTKKNEVSAEDPPSSASEIDISSLDDIDYGSSSEFKMRKSWLQEPSLNSVTMPNISFDDW